MTSETIHTISPSYTFQPSHLAQLQHIADTDEFLHDEDASQPLPSSSSSSANTPEIPSAGYDWIVLKDAIKYRIKQCLEEDFGKETGVELHPAAAAGLGQEGSEEGSKSQPVDSTEDGAKHEGKESAEAEPEAEAEAIQLNGIQVAPADAQNFYPTKRPPSTLSSTYQALSSTEISSYTSLLFSMLDDFDLQPPFTIQRLCELVTSPTTHYRSGAKWVGAVKRCLSATATRDAFPISPVQAPIGMTNGVHAEGTSQELSEVDMDRMDGLPPARSRSSSVTSNNAEPLFSPIPFIVRDENGQLKHSGNADGETEGQEKGGMMEPIPALELGGADRTSAVNAVPRELVDVVPSADKGDGDGENVAMADAESGSPAEMSADAGEGGIVAAAVEATTTGLDEGARAADSTSAAGGAEPLGVPPGAVDEIDNSTQTVNPITSTTSSASEDTASEHKAQEAPTEPNDSEEQDSGRSHKRRKSVASVDDPRN